MTEQNESLLIDSIDIDTIVPSDFRYSVCSLVTNLQEYSEMLESFKTKGFDNNNVEFLYLNNTNGNKYDGYKGINKILQIAKGDYIIVCHQDVLLVDDNYDTLNKLIEEVNELDPSWAILGNAGVSENFRSAIRITDPLGENVKRGQLPAQVCSLDENFMVINKLANLGASKDLEGFHFYATDLCINADVRGYKCYVIDFHLKHKSRGNANAVYYIGRSKFVEKYRRAFRSRFVPTPSSTCYLSSSKILSIVFNSERVKRYVLFPILTIINYFKSIV